MSTNTVTEQLNNNVMIQPIKNVIDLVMKNCYLQSQGVKVAIPYITSKPGAGKTEIYHSETLKKHWGIISTHFAVKPIEETGGIPQFTKIKIGDNETLSTIWSLPDIMAQLFIECDRITKLHDKLFQEGKIQQKDPVVIWMLDDMHLCSAGHLAMMYELFTERKLRDYHLPKNCALALAGNHGSNKAGAKTMLSAIINRIFLCPAEATYKDWRKDFAIANNIHPAIISFLGQERYSFFFHQDEEVETPWCSPRSWTHLSNLMAPIEQWNGKALNEIETLYYATGHVGKTAASEFAAYYKIYSQFDVENIIKNAKMFKIPDTITERYALAYALCNYYGSHKNPNNIVDKFTLIVLNYYDHDQSLAFMILQTLIDMETILGKTSLLNKVIQQMDTIRENVTIKILEHVEGK